MGLFDWLAPVIGGLFGGKRRKAKKVSATTFAPTDAGDATPPKLLLADLAGDKKGEATDHLSEQLTAFQGWEVYRTRRPLQLPPEGNLVERLLVASDEGRHWVKEEGADILLWGELDIETIRLRFLPAIPSPDTQPGSFGLGDMLVLPANFTGGLERVLYVAVLAAVGPTYRGARTRIGEWLAESLQAVKGYVETSPPELNQEQHASILTCIGNGFAAHSRLGGSRKRLGHAIATYKLAKTKISPDTSPVPWAVMQSHLAAAHRAKGEVEKDPASLKAAAVVYSQTSDTLGRVANPYDWALAQLNLGMVLYKLAAMEGEPVYLEQSGKAFDEALSVYTKEKMPARWAEVTNLYGVVLMAQGEEGGDVPLEQAIKKFRKALEVRKRDRMPVLWAQTANNLGAACFALAKRNSEAGLLREAASCFEGAREVYEQTGAQKTAQIIAKNLSRVERLLDTRNG